MSLAFVRLLRYIEQIDSMLPCVFFFIKIDHRRGQNVLARTSGADLANGSCIIFCSYHILTSFVINFWTDVPKDNKHNSLHLAQKHARIFVLGHYLFFKADIFLQAMLSYNCSSIGPDMSANKYPCIFSRHMKASFNIL